MKAQSKKKNTQMQLGEMLRTGQGMFIFVKKILL